VDNVVSIEKLETSRAIGGIQVKTLDDLSRLSKMLAASGFFEDCKQAAQAGVKVICGMELGFPAFALLDRYLHYQGKACHRRQFDGRSGEAEQQIQLPNLGAH